MKGKITMKTINNINSFFEICRTLEQVKEEAKTISPEMEKKMQQSGFFQIKAKEYSEQMHQLKVPTVNRIPLETA